MVGHTHEDIDAAFSKVSNTLRTNDAETLPDLQLLLPSLTDVHTIYNVRDWLSPNILDVRKHTTPLHYKFSRSSDLIKVSYKGQRDSPWREIESGLLKRNQNGIISKIRGIPKLVPINFDGIGLEKIETKMKSWKCLFSDQIDHSQFEWWKSFVTYWNSLKDSPAKCKKEVYDKAKWILPNLPRQPVTDETSEDEGSAVPQSIQTLLDAEVAVSQVNVNK